MQKLSKNICKPMRRSMLNFVWSLHRSPGSFGRREQGAPAALSYMTPFEYYMHLFAQVPLAGGQQPSVSPTNGWSADSLYPFLLEDYLNAFLPLDESSQAKLYSSCAASHPSFPATVAQPAPMMTMMAYRPQFKSPSTTGGLSLFRQGLGQPATKASPAPPPGPQGLFRGRAFLGSFLKFPRSSNFMSNFYRNIRRSNLNSRS